jgi:ribosomal protein S18 acetylase RimI-like enzyme
MSSTSMSIKFRPAQISDIPAVAGLIASLFAIEADFAADTTRQVAALKLMLLREDILLWVAEEVLDGDSQVVGFCSVQTLISTAEGGPVGLVEDVVVADGWRGAGIGRRLLEGTPARVYPPAAAGRPGQRQSPGFLSPPGLAGDTDAQLATHAQG